MMVEVYLEKELSDITFEVEAIEEWKKLSEELGLDAQLGLTRGKSGPAPFPYMNKVMKTVYEVLCSTHCEVKDYTKTAIPLIVLQTYKLCKDANYFETYEVWYNDKNPDPLLVGKAEEWYLYSNDGEIPSEYKKKTYTSRSDAEADGLLVEEQIKDKVRVSTRNTNYYLIARWGDVLKKFDELKKLALDRLVETKGAQIKADIITLEGKLKTIKEQALLYLAGEISESKAFSSSTW